MTNLTNLTPSQSYGDLITLGNDNDPGLGLNPPGTLKNVQDGNGLDSPMQIATDAVNFSRAGGNEFQLDGVALTADTARLNDIALDNPDFSWSTGLLGLPSGTTAQRPVGVTGGDIRYNEDTNLFEGYIEGVGWRSFQMVP
jgi:hypothetical protein